MILNKRLNVYLNIYLLILYNVLCMASSQSTNKQIETKY